MAVAVKARGGQRMPETWAINAAGASLMAGMFVYSIFAGNTGWAAIYAGAFVLNLLFFVASLSRNREP